MARLSQTFCTGTQAPTAGYNLHWDDQLKGFGLRVTSNGVKSFILNYYFDGKKCRWTIGQLGAWNADQARVEAQRLRRMIDRGEDPSAIEQVQIPAESDKPQRNQTIERNQRKGRKLNQTFCKSVKPPKAEYDRYWDDELKGFGLRVTASGVKSFILDYRIHGKKRCWTIGQLGAWTAETARQEARRLRTLVDRGEDPFAIERAQKQQAIEDEARQRTMKELADHYLADHAEVHKRPGSVKGDREMLNGIILPKLGRMRVSSLGRGDVVKLHNSLKGTPYRANRVLALLHKMFNIALADEKGQWGLAGNPAHGVQKFPEEKRERWLNEEELQQVADALENYPEKCASEAQVGDKQRAYIRKEAQRAVNAIRLSMVTGCRSGEALTAKWTDFDLARGVWTKPSHHTKEKKTEHVPLSAQAQELLKALPHDGDYLFPGRPGRKSKGEHLTTLKGQWEKICTMAKLDGVRIHDLRHSFASHLVSSGVSLPVVGKLLGHTQVQTTQRYAHVADDPQREAANKFPHVL